MQRGIFSSVILGSSALFGCSESFSPPICRVADKVQAVSSPRYACLLTQDKQALLLRNDDDKLLMPSVESSNNVCHLHQHVWETTGLNIEVAQLAFASESQHIFICTIDNHLIIPENGLALPDWRDSYAFETIEPIDVFQIRSENLSDGKDLAPIREAYVTAIANINKDQ